METTAKNYLAESRLDTNYIDDHRLRITWYLDISLYDEYQLLIR